ncbi:hypothetical protein ATO6_01185 [Oceanicola sp. 22II-s10i]|uniref:hypothetical protein n=1 Tax=Oceanicola sp. 22II-s10i TaxID=1317116 RepID=UPI000B521BEB|nr:hypothetical protein [Oceanicola sp. 22II-s10i]OWU85578.1 hypothetical protein ATO6_01185 [Oceanicola sp. 22II-s10i]
MRLTALAATLAIAAGLPAAAQPKIETPQMVVYEGQWVQTKVAGQKGALMFLTVPRGQKGEYFSISCERAGGGLVRTIKLGYPKPIQGDNVPITLNVDGQVTQATASFTGKARDDAYTKADIHTYALKFPSAADEQAVFRAMQRGNTLKVPGQTLPVDLRGFTAAFQGQTAYCD